jgi:hypothetical protein
MQDLKRDLPTTKRRRRIHEVSPCRGEDAGEDEWSRLG